jgi:hypothetical protein
MRLRESGLHGRIAAKKPLLKDTNKKTCLGHETQAMNIRPVEICSLGRCVQIWVFWFQTTCLCETQRRWTNDLCMCGSHCEAQRRWCDGVGVICWWHCQWFTLKNEPVWLPQHSAVICHPIWFVLSRTIICFSTGQWPNTPPGCVRAMWPRRVMECCIR